MFEDSCIAKIDKAGIVPYTVNLQHQVNHVNDDIPVCFDILSNCDTKSSTTNSSCSRRPSVNGSNVYCSSDGFIPVEHGVALNEETVSNVSSQSFNLDGLSILDKLDLYTDRVYVTTRKKIQIKRRDKVKIARCLQCGRFCLRNVNCTNCTKDLDFSQISTGTSVQDKQLSNTVTVSGSIKFQRNPFCASCRRCSTVYHELNLSEIETNDIINKKFGAKIITNMPCALLCQVCQQYRSKGQVRKTVDFTTAWPCVFWSFFTDDNLQTADLWSKLPPTVLLSWIHADNFDVSSNNILYNFVSVPVFQDISDDLIEFRNFFEKWTSHELLLLLNKHYFPVVKCPVGCWTFIEKTGSISFNHYLSFLVRSYTAFGSNGDVYLRGLRFDYADHEKVFPDDDLCPVVKPTIFFTDGVPYMATCEDHDQKIPHQYCHVPKSPLNRLTSSLSDRFSPAVLSTRTMKPFRPNFSSASFKMYKMEGSFQGTSTCYVSEQRRLDNVDDALLRRERLYMNYRADVRRVLMKLVTEEVVSKKFAEEVLFLCENYDGTMADKCLQGSTFVPLEYVGLMKQIQSLSGGFEEKEVFIDRSNNTIATGVVQRYSPALSDPNVLAGDHSTQFRLRDERLPTQSLSSVTTENALNITPVREKICWGKTIFPCVKALDRLLGAPPSCIVTQCAETNTLMLLSCNSAVFISDIIDLHLRERSNVSYKILSCFTQKRKDALKRKLNSLTIYLKDVSLNCFFARLPFVKTVFVDNRQNHVSSYVDISMSPGEDFIHFYSDCKTLRNAKELPSSVELGDKKYHCILVCAENTSLFFKYKHSQFWWRSGKKIFQSTVHDNVNDLLFRNNWTYCIYEVETSHLDSTEMKQSFINNFGQSKALCGVHKCFLTTDFPKTQFRCHVNVNCRNTSAWRCPQGSCSVAVCRKHFQQTDARFEVFELAGKKDPQRRRSDVDEHMDFHSCSTKTESNVEEQSFESSDLPAVFFEGPTDGGIFNDEPVIEASDAGVLPVSSDSCGDSTAISSNVVINGFCSLLTRPKTPMHFPKKVWRYLQNFVSNCPFDTVPLTFPEAMLFPSIFYSQQNNSFIGAIPHTLIAPKNFTYRFNFADIEQQLRARLRNGSLLTSCDPRVLSFYFDIFLNFKCIQRDVRFVMNRGLTDINDHHMSPHEPRLKMDEQDSRRLVNELAAAFRDRDADFLLTITLNMQTMFGVSPLYDLIERNTKKEFREVKNRVIESFMPLYMLMWERACTYFVEYLLKSPEKPLGSVVRIFPRFEFQTSRGNAPHMHIVIWITESKHDVPIRKKVVGSFRELYAELRKLFDYGSLLISDENDLEYLMDLAHTVLSHDCEKSFYRCHKKTDSTGNFVCRFKIYQATEETFFEVIHRPHSEEVWEMLCSLDLASKRDSQQNCHEVSDKLTAGKFNYAADFNELFSPVNPLLFALLRGSMNCLLCDKIMSAAYLAKYAAGVEERATVEISGKSDTTVNVTVKGMRNIKIGKSGFLARFEDNTASSTERGRIISSTECIWHMLNLKYVFPTYDVVHVCTLPLEQRGGFVKRRCVRRSRDRAGTTDDLKFVTVRSAYLTDSSRNFTDYQKKTAAEHYRSQLSIDKVSLYCVRAPELLFVQPIEVYFKYFTWQKIECHNIAPKLKTSLEHCCWIDAVGNQFKLRQNCVAAFVQFCCEVASSSDNSHYRFFAQSYASLLTSDPCNCCLVSTEVKDEAVVVFTNVLPRNTSKFLVAFLLSSGYYETEFDLYKVGSLQGAYCQGGLLPSASNITDDAIKKLLKFYITNFGIYVPGSHVSHDKIFLQAEASFNSLRDNNLVQPTPQIIYTALETECNEKVLLVITQKFQLCFRNIYSQVDFANKPTLDDFLSATLSHALPWDFVNDHVIILTKEQQLCFSSIKNVVDAYCQSTTSFIKHQFVVGMPGSGKTFLMVLVLFYARCCGLNFIVTSLSAERSLTFGGSHLHELFALPVTNNPHVSTSVDKSLQKLLFDNARRLFLQRLDVICIEEVGMVSAEEFAIMDIVLQAVKKIALPFGGVLVLATGDPKQLPPPTGTQIWLSPLMLTSVRLFKLSTPVRMVDSIGQDFLNAISQINLEEDDIRSIIEIFSRHCKFQEDIDTTELDAIPIFATRAAERRSIQKKVQALRDSHQSFIEVKCIDEVKTSVIQNWKVDSAVTTFLNKKCLEPSILYLYREALLRVTINLPEHGVTQGQLCVFHLLESDCLTVWVAPPAVRKLPPRDCVGNLEFENNKWASVNLRRICGFVHIRHGQSVRRNQFPVKNFLAMTIHKAMGETIGKVVTKINFNEREYCLWQREQLYVIVSRVHRLEDITFIGNKDETLESISLLLSTSNQWDEYTTTLINTASNCQDFNFDLNKLSIYRPMKISLPDTCCGFVYIIVSTKVVNTFYIGETRDLRRRLHEHNTGKGAAFTSNPDYQPWGLLCYVCGFDDDELLNRQQRKQLEADVQDLIFEKFAIFGHNPNASQTLQLLKNVVAQHRQSITCLRVVICGTYISD